jgi:hypothetical protein
MSGLEPGPCFRAATYFETESQRGLDDVDGDQDDLPRRI